MIEKVTFALPLPKWSSGSSVGGGGGGGVGSNILGSPYLSSGGHMPQASMLADSPLLPPMRFSSHNNQLLSSYHNPLLGGGASSASSHHDQLPSLQLTLQSLFPPPAILSAQPSRVLDHLTSRDRDTIDVNFNPSLVSFDSLVLAYAKWFMDTISSSRWEPSSSAGGMGMDGFGAIYCSSSSQATIATQCLKNDPNVPWLGKIKAVSPNDFQNVMAKDNPITSTGGMNMPSATPGQLNINLDDTLNLLLNSMPPASELGMATPQEPTLSSTTASNLLNKARATNVTVTQLAETLRDLTQRLLPPHESSTVLSDLDAIHRDIRPQQPFSSGKQPYGGPSTVSGSSTPHSAHSSGSSWNLATGMSTRMTAVPGMMYWSGLGALGGASQASLLSPNLDDRVFTSPLSLSSVTWSQHGSRSGSESPGYSADGVSPGDRVIRVPRARRAAALARGRGTLGAATEEEKIPAYLSATWNF